MGKKTLLIFDVFSIWKTCLSVYGKKTRINFEYLINKSDQAKNSEKIALIHRDEESNSSFLSNKIVNLGFNLLEKEEIIAINLNDYKKVTMISSDLDLIGLLNRSCGKSHLYSFSISIQQDLVDNIDKINIIDRKYILL